MVLVGRRTHLLGAKVRGSWFKVLIFKHRGCLSTVHEPCLFNALGQWAFATVSPPCNFTKSEKEMDDHAIFIGHLWC